MLDDAPPPQYAMVGRSDALSPEIAVAEALVDVRLAKTCFILAFVPAHMDVARLAAVLDDKVAGTPVFGCTTAGQISPQGYETNALVLVAFSKTHFRCASLLITPLRPFNATNIAIAARQLSKTFRHTAGWNRLGLLLTDGLSKQEDFLISTLEANLLDFPIFGGSAGDGLRFKSSFVLHHGQVHTNAAVLVLLETQLAFQGLGFDHFLPRDQLLVITEADHEERLVYQINGTPAAIEYARLVGCDVEALSPEVFAENPLLLEHNNRHYVRAIGGKTEDNALVFLAAIEEGLIMTLGRGTEIVATLTAGLDVKAKSIHAPDFVLGFDCVLRKLEIEQKALSATVSRIMAANRVFGFSTYGEQQSGLHMNQTFVGVAFFGPDRSTQLS